MNVRRTGLAALVAATVLTAVVSIAGPASAAVSSCTPTAAHPFPVVLVHGTFETSQMWSQFQPVLQQAGYCVSAIDYNSTQDIARSAANLSTFVDQVLAASHASKVDIVGHSQGGMMPRYYLKNLGGAAKVHRLVGLAPSNYGTTLNGLANLLGGFGNGVLLGCTACTQQVQGSAFLTALNSPSDTLPGVIYNVIETNKDEIVTPFTNAFLRGAGATNQLVQDTCAADAAGHIALATEDRNAWQLTLNALDPEHATPITCAAENNPI